MSPCDRKNGAPSNHVFYDIGVSSGSHRGDAYVSFLNIRKRTMRRNFTFIRSRVNNRSHLPLTKDTVGSKGTMGGIFC